MPDDVKTETATEDLDWDDLLSEYEPEVEAAEKGKDDIVAKLTKNQRALAEKQAKMEAQQAREKMVGEFYAKANDEEKQFADVLLAGVSDPDKVKKMLELAHAKAEAVAPATEDTTEEDETSDIESAFSAPVESSKMSRPDPARERADRTRKGDVHAAFIEFMDLPATAATPKG